MCTLYNCFNTCKDTVFKIKLFYSKSKLICSYRWLADNEDELKNIYRVLLRNNITENNYSQLMIAINQLLVFLITWEWIYM